MKIYYSRKIFSFASVSLLFLVFLSVFSPVINSDDDIYFLYQLGGGYGAAPSNLLHYNYTLNPVLTWPLAKLFNAWPGINWYSVFLIAIHFFSCWFFFYTILALFDKFKTLILFFIFFCFVEGRLLLSLHYSNTCLIAAIAGFTGVLVYFMRKPQQPLSRLFLICSCVLIIVAAWMRFHVTSLFALLSILMGLVLLSRKVYKPWIITLIIIAGIIVTGMIGHKAYYKAMIPGWQQEETYRQAVFSLYNRPNEAQPVTLTVKQQFIRSSFLYDTLYTGLNDIREFRSDMEKAPVVNAAGKGELFHWIFVSTRVYFMLLAALFLLLLSNRSFMMKWLVLFIISISLLIYLHINFKITETIFMSAYAALLVMATLCFSMTRLDNRKRIGLSLLLAGISCSWMLWQLYKINRENESGMNKVECFLKEIGQHRDTLFISTDNIFPARKFSIWQTPHHYPLVNFLNKELAISFVAKDILNRYSVKTLLSEIPHRTNIILVGEYPAFLTRYYKEEKGIDVVVKEVPGFTCLKGYQLSLP